MKMNSVLSLENCIQERARSKRTLIPTQNCTQHEYERPNFHCKQHKLDCHGFLKRISMLYTEKELEISSSFFSSSASHVSVQKQGKT